MNRILLKYVCIFFVLLCANFCYAQQEIKLCSASISTSADVQVWAESLEEADQGISQAIGTIALSLPVGNILHFSAKAPWMFSTIGHNALSGSCGYDFNVLMSPFRGVVLNAGMSTPDSSNVKYDEAAFFPYLSNRMFDFKYTGLSHGVNGNFGLGLSHSYRGRLDTAIGVGYLYRNEYRYFDSIRYDPGDQVYATGDIDILLCELLSIRANASYARFTYDRINGVFASRQGDVFNISSTGMIEFLCFTSTVTGFYMDQGKSRIILQTGETGKVDFSGVYAGGEAIIKARVFGPLSFRLTADESVMLDDNVARNVISEVKRLGAGFSLEFRNFGIDMSGKYQCLSNGDSAEMYGLSTLIALTWKL